MVTRLPGLPGLQGLRWPSIKGSCPISNLRLRGYRVTNGLNFFFNFLSNVRLRGYRVTNRLNFLSLNFQNEKVTRLPGLQGLQ